MDADPIYLSIAQIILIPILTVLLSSYLESAREQGKRSLEKDRELFTSIKSSFTEGSNLATFFRDHSVGDLVNRAYISQAYTVKENLEQPGAVFVDRQLESIRKLLLEKISSFLAMTQENFFVHRVLNEYYELRYREAAGNGELEAQEKFSKLRMQIDKIGTEVHETYVKLAEIAQKKL